MEESENHFIREQTTSDRMTFLIMKTRRQQETFTSAAVLHTCVISVTHTWTSSDVGFLSEEQLLSPGHERCFFFSLETSCEQKNLCHYFTSSR